MTPSSASALVLAAGLSERMGDFKPLVRLGGSALLERVVRLFRTAGVGAVHVVVGHRAGELVPLVHRWGARVVHNPRFADGMFSSVRAGVSCLDPSAEAFFVLPVDIPLVRPATLRDLLAAFPAGCDAVCHPTFGGKRGHPPLIGAGLAGQILSWRGDGGLGGLLAEREGAAVDVPVVDAFIHRDMDRPEDHRDLERALAGRDVLSPAECAALLEERMGAPPSVVAHGRAVAGAAVRIARALNDAGASLDLSLVRSAALVHDMARGRPDHAGRAAAILREMDLHRMADVVGAHMDLAGSAAGPLGEAEVVFLADKLVRGDRVVGLAERFRRRLEGPLAEPAAREAARRRLETARGIAGRVEAAAGAPLDRLLPVGPLEGRGEEEKADPQKKG